MILEEVLECKEDLLAVNPSCEYDLKSLSDLLVEQVRMASICSIHYSSLCSGSGVDFCGGLPPLVPDPDNYLAQI